MLKPFLKSQMVGSSPLPTHIPQGGFQPTYLPGLLAVLHSALRIVSRLGIWSLLTKQIFLERLLPWDVCASFCVTLPSCLPWLAQAPSSLAEVPALLLLAFCSDLSAARRTLSFKWRCSQGTLTCVPFCSVPLHRFCWDLSAMCSDSQVLTLAVFPGPFLIAF